MVNARSAVKGVFEDCNTVPTLSFFLRHEIFLLMLGALAISICYKWNLNMLFLMVVSVHMCKS
jgi:hypothetical protein